MIEADDPDRWEADVDQRKEQQLDQDLCTEARSIRWLKGNHIRTR
jgi:hypothetical protein